MTGGFDPSLLARRAPEATQLGHKGRELPVGRDRREGADQRLDGVVAPPLAREPGQIVFEIDLGHR